MQRRRSTQKLPAKNLLPIIAAIGALLMGYYVADKLIPAPPPLELKSATLYPPHFRSMPAFRLTDENNDPFTEQELTGYWNLIFFGYTYCPDVCPNTLSVLQQTKTALAAQNPKVKLRIIFASIDPERDTPAKLAPYIHYFDPEFRAITGGSSETQKLARHFGVFFRKTIDPKNPTHYLIDHSTGIFLLNPATDLVALFSPPHNSTDITADLLSIMQHKG